MIILLEKPDVDYPLVKSADNYLVIKIPLTATDTADFFNLMKQGLAAPQALVLLLNENFPEKPTTHEIVEKSDEMAQAIKDAKFIYETFGATHLDMDIAKAARRIVDILGRQHPRAALTALKNSLLEKGV